MFQWAIQRFKTHSENHYWEAAFKHPVQLFVTAFSVAAEACRRCYSPPSASHCFNGQHGNIVSRFKSSKLKREIISFNFFCTGDSDSPKPTRGKLRSNMLRHTETACENEGTERNQSESLAGSCVELLIPYLESWYEEKKIYRTEMKTLTKEMEMINPPTLACTGLKISKSTLWSFLSLESYRNEQGCRTKFWRTTQTSYVGLLTASQVNRGSRWEGNKKSGQLHFLKEDLS